MVEIHAVARLLTLEQRQRAAAVTYQVRPAGDGTPSVRHVDDESRCLCPLAMAFEDTHNRASREYVALTAAQWRAAGLPEMAAEIIVQRFTRAVDYGIVKPEAIAGMLGIGPGGEDLLA